MRLSSNMVAFPGQNKFATEIDTNSASFAPGGWGQLRSGQLWSESGCDSCFGLLTRGFVKGAEIAIPHLKARYGAPAFVIEIEVRATSLIG